MPEFAVPQLPMRDMAQTRAFYEKLGFICAHEHPPPDSFLVLIRGGLHLQFFELPSIEPTLNAFSAYLYVEDVDTTYAEFAAAKVGRLMPIELKPWGVREFALFDPVGTLLRVASPRLDFG